MEFTHGTFPSIFEQLLCDFRLDVNTIGQVPYFLHVGPLSFMLQVNRSCEIVYRCNDIACRCSEIAYHCYEVAYRSPSNTFPSPLGPLVRAAPEAPES
jgi:hypothetical protein